jgi:hypothetical protein
MGMLPRGEVGLIVAALGLRTGVLGGGDPTGGLWRRRLLQ